jgi:hypothetical protein
VDVGFGQAVEDGVGDRLHLGVGIRRADDEEIGDVGDLPEVELYVRSLFRKSEPGDFSEIA